MTSRAAKPSKMIGFGVAQHMLIEGATLQIIRYAAWDLSDLEGNMISLFLLNDAAAYFNHEAPAKVFAILNPEIIDARGVLLASPRN